MSKGEENSVRSISAQFRKLGLKPGNPNGTYAGSPMAGILHHPRSQHQRSAKKKVGLHAPEEFVAFTSSSSPASK